MSSRRFTRHDDGIPPSSKPSRIRDSMEGIQPKTRPPNHNLQHPESSDHFLVVDHLSLLTREEKMMHNQAATGDHHSYFPSNQDTTQSSQRLAASRHDNRIEEQGVDAVHTHLPRADREGLASAPGSEHPGFLLSTASSAAPNSTPRQEPAGPEETVPRNQQNRQQLAPAAENLSSTLPGGRTFGTRKGRRLFLRGLFGTRNDETHNENEDAESRPGQFTFHPSTISSQPETHEQRVHQQQHHTNGPGTAPTIQPEQQANQNHLIAVDEEVHVTTAPMPERRLKRKDAYTQKYKQQREVWKWLRTILLASIAATSFGLGFGFGLSNKKSHSIPGPCDLEAILSECNDNNNSTIVLQNRSSECLVRYNRLRNEWLVPRVDPAFSAEATSCDPINLALWALVVDSDASHSLERFVLRTLFFSTSGPTRWLHRNGWFSETASECEWYGITCNDITLEVENISLASNLLDGTIPSQLTLLTSLKVISLPNNALRGTIPNDFVIQTSLSHLALESNSLTGTLPTELFASFPSLETIKLSSNGLHGMIPNDFAFQTNLSNLALDANSLTGVLPTELFRSFPSLVELSVGSNDLFGLIPTEVALLSGLKRFAAESNRLAGPIPSAFGGCLNLTHLSMAGNSLTGDLPSSLGQLEKLEVLSLSANNLQVGQLPSWFWDLTLLEVLALGGSGLDRSISAQVGSLTHMMVLDMNSNVLTGILPTELGSLTEMTLLDVTSNDLSGSLPAELGLLTNMEILTMSNNNLNGTIPTILGFLNALRVLALDRNSLTGNLPTEIGLLSNLEEFYFWDNDLQGVIPHQICNLRNSELTLFGRSICIDPYGGLRCPTSACCRDCPLFAP